MSSMFLCSVSEFDYSMENFVENHQIFTPLLDNDLCKFACDRSINIEVICRNIRLNYSRDFFLLHGAMRLCSTGQMSRGEGNTTDSLADSYKMNAALSHFRQKKNQVKSKSIKGNFLDRQLVGELEETEGESGTGTGAGTRPEAMSDNCAESGGRECSLDWRRD